MPVRIAVIAIGVAVAALVSGTRTIRAQSNADLFDSQTVQNIQLLMNSRDKNALREKFQDEIPFPADLIWGNIRVRNVAVRSRGVKSRNPFKLGLRVDFNFYTRGQQFLGLKSLVLDNLWTDPAMIRESVAMAFINHMGQPASRESFARVFINDEWQGLYAVVEVPDGDYLTRHLGENGGYLHKFNFARPYHGEDLGENLVEYKPFFDPQSHELEADELLYGPIRDLIREANHDVDAVWLDRVGAFLDLSQLATYTAIETFLAEDDGIVGSAGMANFYLYRYAGTTRHRLLPWDRDTTFAYLDPDMMLRVDSNEIVRRALSIPQLRTTYLNVLEECARSAAADNWLLNEIDRQIAVIADVARQDPRKFFSNEEFEQGIAFLRQFAVLRPAQVRAEVQKLR